MFSGPITRRCRAELIQFSITLESESKIALILFLIGCKIGAQLFDNVPSKLKQQFWYFLDTCFVRTQSMSALGSISFGFCSSSLD